MATLLPRVEGKVRADFPERGPQSRSRPPNATDQQAR